MGVIWSLPNPWQSPGGAGYWGPLFSDQPLTERIRQRLCWVTEELDRDRQGRVFVIEVERRRARWLEWAE